MPLSHRKKLAVVLAAPLLVFGVAELALRIADYEYSPEPPALIVWNPTLDTELEAGEGLHAPDPHCLWLPRAGAEPVPGERINAERLRGPIVPRERTSGVGRVLLLGESSMFGMQVDYASTIAGRLPALMSARGLDIEVINGAVIGHTVWQGLARYESSLRELRPDVCVASFGAINEHFYAKDLPDREKLQALAPPLGLLPESMAALREGSRVVQAFAALVDVWNADPVAERQRHEAIIASRRGMNISRDAVGQREFAGQRRASLESFREGLEKLERALAADGVQLVLVSMPRKPYMEGHLPVIVDYSEALVAFAQDARVPLVPLRDWFLEHCPTPESADAYFLPDQRLHPSALGHQQAAEMIAPMIEAPLRLRLDWY